MLSSIPKEQFIIATDVDSSKYFYTSVELFETFDCEGAISFIDLAINTSTKKEFYMFQKVKMLFALQMYSRCAVYIEDYLLFFYSNCSLYIFSKILHYYHISTDCSTYLLRKLLSDQNIPTVIAIEYESISNKGHSDFFKKALLAKSNNDFLTCISYCDLLLREHNDDPSIYITKGECHHLLGEHDLALLMYQKAILIAPNNDLIHHDLGIIMMALERYPEAIASFNEATDLVPSNIKYKINLGEAFYRWKKYDSALKCFKEVIHKTPTHIDSYLRIAEIYIQINQTKKAKKYYKKANHMGRKMPTV